MDDDQHDYDTTVEWTHARVVVKPRIIVGPDVDRTKLERVIKMTEKHCFISNSLSGEVRLEPEIVVA